MKLNELLKLNIYVYIKLPYDFLTMPITIKI